MRILEGLFFLWILGLVTLFCLVLLYGFYIDVVGEPLINRDVKVIQKEKVIEKENQKIVKPTYNVTGSGRMVCIESENGTKKCYEEDKKWKK